MLYVIGDSHTLALRNAHLQDEGQQSADISKAFDGVSVGMIATAGELLAPFHKRHDQEIRFLKPDCERRFEAITGLTSIRAGCADPIIVSAGFHFMGVLKRPIWTTYSVLTDTEKNFISTTVLRQIVQSYHASVVQFARDLVALNRNVIFLESPPIKARMSASPKIKMNSVELIATNLKYRKAVSFALVAAGARVIAYPDETQKRGVMLADYDSAADGYHGNREYGQAMWKKIRNLRNRILDRSASLDEMLIASRLVGHSALREQGIETKETAFRMV